MHLSSEAVTEDRDLLLHFDERFCAYRDCRIGLSSGKFQQEILRLFGNAYRFLCLDPECSQIPAELDLVLLTGSWEELEEGYARIGGACEERGLPLLDLFGLDQIALRRELREQEYLSIPQWKELLSGYDVITFPAPGAVVKYNKLQGSWAVRRRFLILYRWLLSQNKTVLFFREREELIGAFEAEKIDYMSRMLDRSGEALGYPALLRQYPGKKMIHIGTDVVKDGILPRRYGIASRMIRGFRMRSELSTEGRDEWVCADRAQLLEEIDRHDVISFDIFDTLIKRTVLVPKDVFEIVQARTGIEGFADMRYRIQTERPELSLDEMYSCLMERCAFDDQTASLLRRTELQLEFDLIMPRSSMIEILEYAKSRGKTVVLVSDMYLDVSVIRRLLEKNGITGYSELYISYQYKKLKQHGLYEEMKKNRRSGETILHIGDNRYSDCYSARKYGLDVFYIPSGLDLARQNGYEQAIQMCRSLAERKLLGLGIALGFDDPFRRQDDALLSDMVVAPLSMAYLLWVIGRFREKRYDRFLLASRDGWILLDAYEKMRSRSGGQLPPGLYFYLNRHAAFLTIMDDAELVKYVLHLPSYDADPPGLLRRQFCLPEDALLPWAGETAEQYCRMHASQIHAAAERYRENYRKYLERSDLEETTCAVMDLFAEGTSQMMLARNMPCRLDGYYVGAPEYMFRYARDISYYLDTDMVDYNTEMKIERFFTSMEPALDRIDEKGRPVFAPETRDPALLRRIGRVHAQVRGYLDRYIDLLYDPGDEMDPELAFALCRSVNNYAAEGGYFDDMSGKPIAAEEKRSPLAAQERVNPERGDRRNE